MDDKPFLKGAWLCHSPVFNFWGPIYISGIAETRVAKFCTQGDYSKSCQRDNKAPQKGEVVGLLSPILACTAVDVGNFAKAHR